MQKTDGSHVAVQGESVAKPEALLTIPVSVESEYDIKVLRRNASNPLFIKNVRKNEYPREVNKCRHSIQ